MEIGNLTITIVGIEEDSIYAVRKEILKTLVQHKRAEDSITVLAVTVQWCHEVNPAPYLIVQDGSPVGAYAVAILLSHELQIDVVYGMVNGCSRPNSDTCHQTRLRATT